MPKVSILVPVYKVEEYIEQCVRSLFGQTLEDIEFIFVDDCSPDGSVQIINQVLKEYPWRSNQTTIIHHENNRGLAAARNTAVEAASGEFVFHLDSDDWLEPKAIELLVNKQKETESDIVSGAAVRHRRKCKDKLIEPDYATPIDLCHNAIEMTIDHVIWRRLIRKALYTDHGISAIEGVNIGEDHHTLPRLAYYAKKIAKIDDVVYNYNCLNINSYMSQNTRLFNIARFNNNMSSIDILSTFFLNKDDYCTKRLKEIRLEYIHDSLCACCLFSDRQSFNQISSKYGINKSYNNFMIKAYLKYIKSKL